MDIFALKNNSEIFTGWTLNFNEVSNNVYKFEMTDKYGRKAGCTDHDFERGIETCASYAFDIEKQTNKNWRKFLFDYFRFKLSPRKLTEEIYHEMAFGSWTIQLNKRRIILEGKDSIITSQYISRKQKWNDKESIKIIDLTFDKIQPLIDFLVNIEIADKKAHTTSTWQKILGLMRK